MRYQLHGKLVSFGGDYMIQDASGRDIFNVDSKLGFSRKLQLKDMQGNILANIQQKKSLYQNLRG